jgi:hypothetical protein
MTEEAIRAFVSARILSRISGAGARRDEALRAVLGVAAPGLNDASLDRLVSRTPELPVTLYEKWVGMFVDRLLETVPLEQASDLCANTAESNASLQLVYAMFMESSRMEAVVEDDLRLWLQDAPGDGGPGERQ